jgi:hypothetical protein
MEKAVTTMAKKTPRRSGDLKDTEPPTFPFDEMFPTIARWISQEDGWVALGADHYSRSTVRALHGGGMVWEGTDEYKSLDEALRAMEVGIATWLEEYRPDGSTVEEVRRPKIGSRNQAGKKAENQARATSPGQSASRKKSSSKAKAPKRDDRVKPDATPAVPRAIVEKVRKFAEMAEGLRRGQHFEITRLTTLKGLCKDPRAARSLALFLAVHARKIAEEKKATERVKGLIDKAITEMESYLDDPTKERKERLHNLLREIEKEQDEYNRIGWGQVRIVYSMELVVVENALKSILREVEAPIWLYQAARDYAERYDPRHGTGLIPSSAPMMQEIADFWRDHFGLDR